MISRSKNLIVVLAILALTPFACKKKTNKVPKGKPRKAANKKAAPKKETKKKVAAKKAAPAGNAIAKAFKSEYGLTPDITVSANIKNLFASKTYKDFAKKNKKMVEERLKLPQQKNCKVKIKSEDFHNAHVAIFPQHNMIYVAIQGNFPAQELVKCDSKPYKKINGIQVYQANESKKKKRRRRWRRRRRRKAKKSKGVGYVFAASPDTVIMVGTENMNMPLKTKTPAKAMAMTGKDGFLAKLLAKKGLVTKGSFPATDGIAHIRATNVGQFKTKLPFEVLTGDIKMGLTDVFSLNIDLDTKSPTDAQGLVALATKGTKGAPPPFAPLLKALKIQHKGKMAQVRFAIKADVLVKTVQNVVKQMFSFGKRRRR